MDASKNWVWYTKNRVWHTTKNAVEQKKTGLAHEKRQKTWVWHMKKKCGCGTCIKTGMAYKKIEKKPGFGTRKKKKSLCVAHEKGRS